MKNMEPITISKIALEGAKKTFETADKARRMYSVEQALVSDRQFDALKSAAFMKDAGRSGENLLPIDVKEKALDVNKSSDSLKGSAFYGKNMNELLGEANNKVMQDILRVERDPRKFQEDVAKRIAEKSDYLNEQAWQASDNNGKLAMLHEMNTIMAEEGCIPRDLIKTTKLEAGKFEGSTNAETNLFIMVDHETGMLKTDPSLKPVKITFNEEVLRNPDYTFKNAMETLYHENIHVMQQQCLCEPGNTFMYAEQKNEWKKNVLDRMSGTKEATSDNPFVDYITDPMENFAHGQASTFIKVYNDVSSKAEVTPLWATEKMPDNVSFGESADLDVAHRAKMVEADIKLSLSNATLERDLNALKRAQAAEAKKGFSEISFGSFSEQTPEQMKAKAQAIEKAEKARKEAEDKLNTLKRDAVLHPSYISSDIKDAERAIQAAKDAENKAKYL